MQLQQPSVEDVVADGDSVVVRLTWSGTHRGPFGQMQPTGKHVTFSAIDVIQVVGGRWAEECRIDDMFAMLQEPRLVPAVAGGAPPALQAGVLS